MKIFLTCGSGNTQKYDVEPRLRHHSYIVQTIGLVKMRLAEEAEVVEVESKMLKVCSVILLFR